MRGIIHQIIRQIRLLLVLGVLLSAVLTAQAIRCPTPGAALNSQPPRQSREMPSQELELSYGVGAVYDDGRMGLFVGNNPIDAVDPSGQFTAAFGRAWIKQVQAGRDVSTSSGTGWGAVLWNTAVGSFATLGESIPDVLLFGDALGAVSADPCAGKSAWAKAVIQDTARGTALASAASGIAARGLLAAEGATAHAFSSAGTTGTGSISLDEALAAAQRNGIDTRMFKLEYGGAHPRYFGSSSFTPTDLTLESFKIARAPDGRAIITLYDKGLSSQQAAVETIAHEVNHIRGVFQSGTITSEEAAEAAARAAGQHFK